MVFIGTLLPGCKGMTILTLTALEETATIGDKSFFEYDGFTTIIIPKVASMELMRFQTVRNWHMSNTKE